MPDHDNATQVAAAAATLTNPTTRTANTSTNSNDDRVQFPSVSTEVQGEIAERLPQALSYLDTVKAAFQDEPGKYATFLSILKAFQTGENDTATTVERVATLLREHPEVIEGYNTFLPDGYRVQNAQGPGGVNVVSVVTPQGTRII